MFYHYNISLYIRALLYICNMYSKIQKTTPRKVHFVGTSAVITLDPKLVKSLNIDDTTFLLQEAIDGGIIMKIKKLYSIGD
jgi:hypothetical protein